MAAGKYRHRITLQSPTRAEDADGKPVASFATVSTVSANVEIKGAGEAIEHRQKRGSITATATVRFTPETDAIKQDWRFLFNGDTYHVLAANDVDGTRKTITIDAEAKPGLI